ncbi:probable RNA polymerase sigma-E factor (sigma-24) protein, ECF subfamily (plasmid) [Rhizobium etli CFN 42]|uniref:RNA polymerase sigma factor protein n=2 Tax=Rhizobium etli TaxID=29449 RepID=A0AAN1BLE7_RHIET|nr:RNA polymerase sigma factor [Rhizobium etli]ABC93344.1 probable RNA polymerase sigma-E factor (sigma-24) protein, ECF subfamily [Rhizobium etli CFN 42]ARQ12557.1 RNA polymerase sigma factor protein [Rhizobium etli]
MDAELIERAQRGDREAFGQLVSRHYDFVRATAWRWSGSSTDADDIAQEVCVKIGAAMRSFRGASHFRTWLYTLTLNAARDHRRKRAREQQTFRAYAAEPRQDAPGGEDEISNALWAAVRALPERQCDAVLLVYGEGLSHSAAADVMGCSEATVSWQVHEARKRLKAMFGKEEV